jgi:putative OPT family oligopeptide transporter
VKSIVIGSTFSALFGVVMVYLALTSGITISPSMTIAILSISVLAKLGKSTIHENNIVLSIGGIAEPVAAGMAFTLPALYLLGATQYLTYSNVVLIGGGGGILGVLLMIPLRRPLVTRQGGEMPFPEARAVANVLKAGEARTRPLVRPVFAGLWVAMTYKVIYSLLRPGNDSVSYTAQSNATLSANLSPEYLGVGYIIGFRVAATLFAGGMLTWLVLIPLLTLLKPNLTPLIGPEIAEKMTEAERYYREYARNISAGAVAAGGLIRLLKSAPRIVSAIRHSLTKFSTSDEREPGGVRVDQDLSLRQILSGLVALIFLLLLMPGISSGPFPVSLVAVALILGFSFLFTTVSCRIVGQIGESSNPVSGMTLATVVISCFVLRLFPRSDTSIYQVVALLIGATVCIAAANAGATAGLFKTGEIVRSSPKQQEVALLIGVVVSAIVGGCTLVALVHSQGIAGHGGLLTVPQASLMATIIQGFLHGEMQTGYLLVGAALAVTMEVCGVDALLFAVGSYLPISVTTTIFIGGTLQALTSGERKSKKQRAKMEAKQLLLDEDDDLAPGKLYSTGLVAGGILTTVGLLFLSVIAKWSPSLSRLGEWLHGGQVSALRTTLGIAVFIALSGLLVRTALQNIKSPNPP